MKRTAIFFITLFSILNLPILVRTAPAQEACTSSSQCNDSNACTVDSCVGKVCRHTPRSRGYVCRAAAKGGCDVAEKCDGTSAACPVDAFRLSTYTCRRAGGVCDLAETCSGTSASCPADTGLLTACINGDGCCPAGCNATNDNNCTTASSCQSRDNTAETTSSPTSNFPSSGRIWYVDCDRPPEQVDRTGPHNPGSVPDNPWTTLSSAIDNFTAVLPGDTVLVKGICHEVLQWRGEQGGYSRAGSDNVTFRSWVPGQRFVVDGSRYPVGDDHRVGVALYYGIDGITLDGIEVRNFQIEGVNLHQSRNITIRNCKIHHNATNPASAGRQCTSNTDTNCSVGLDEGLKEDQSAGTTIDNCEFSDNGPGPGVDLNSHGAYFTASQGLRVINSTFRRNGSQPWNSTGAKSYNYTYPARNILFANNVFCDNYGYGFGIDALNGENIVFRNNIVCDNLGHGLFIETPGRGIKVYNNTFYENQGEGIRITPTPATGATDLDIRNNLLCNDAVRIQGENTTGAVGSFNHNAYVWPRPTTIQRYNGVGGLVGEWNAESWRNELAQDRNSLFLVGSCADLGIDPTTFQLRPDSPLVDAGVDIGLPCRGNGPDIGARESVFERVQH